MTKAMRRIAIAAAVASSIGLAGCFDSEIDIQLNRDGSATIVSRQIVDVDADDMLKALVAFDGLEADPKLEIFKDGLCKGLAANKDLSPVPLEIQVRELREGRNLICETTSKVADFASLGENPLLFSILRIDTKQQKGRTTFALNLGDVPNVAFLVDIGLMTAISQKLEGRTGPNQPSANQLATLGRKGAVAAARTAFKGRTITLSLSGARAMDTTGTLRADGKAASFRVPVTDLIDQLVGTGASSKLPSFRVTVEP